METVTTRLCNIDRRISFRAFIALLLGLGAMPNALAIAVGVLTGAGAPAAATASLTAEAARLTVQGGQAAISALAGEAWTWDFVSATLDRDTRTDTTLLAGAKQEAHAKAEANGFFSRHAVAEGTANKATGVVNPTTSTNKLAVAKSVAGVGENYRSSGAKLGALILAKVSNIVLDPDPIAPGSEALNLVDPLGPSFFKDNSLPDSGGRLA